VNSSEQIRQLEEKGIFTPEQAQRVRKSLDKPVITKEVPLPSLTPLLIGVFLLLLAMIFFTVSTANTTQPEVIAQTLNNTVTSGITASTTLILIIIITSITLYLLLNFILRTNYRTLWDTWLQQEYKQQQLLHTQKYKKSIDKNLQQYMTSEDKEDQHYALSILNAIEQQIQNLQDEIFLLDKRYKTHRKGLFASLTQLVGKLPKGEHHGEH